MVARLDGTLEFLTLGVPTRWALQENSPIKRSSPRVTRKSEAQTSRIFDASNSEASTAVGVKGTRACTSIDSPQCRVIHKLRAHHQPISVLGVMEGRVITGSHDRTLKVNVPFAVSANYRGLVISQDMDLRFKLFQRKTIWNCECIPVITPSLFLELC